MQTATVCQTDIQRLFQNALERAQITELIIASRLAAFLSGHRWLVSVQCRRLIVFWVCRKGAMSYRSRPSCIPRLYFVPLLAF